MAVTIEFHYNFAKLQNYHILIGFQKNIENNSIITEAKQKDLHLVTLPSISELIPEKAVQCLFTSIQPEVKQRTRCHFYHARPFGSSI